MPNGKILQGEIVAGPPGPSGHPVSKADLAAHDFFNVLRHVVRHVPFLNEDALYSALDTVDEYEARNLDGPIEHVRAETDHAKREDVSQRVAPQVGTPVPPAAGPPLDYYKLAAALLALQQQQEQQKQAELPPPPDGGEGNSE